MELIFRWQSTPSDLPPRKTDNTPRMTRVHVNEYTKYDKIQAVTPLDSFILKYTVDRMPRVHVCNRMSKYENLQRGKVDQTAIRSTPYGMRTVMQTMI